MNGKLVQANRDRAAIYGYLIAVFEIVMVWAKEGKAVKRAYRALHLRGHKSVREPEPFAAAILCTADPDKVDERARSKWSRALRYAAEYKDLDEPLRDFIVRRGGAVSTDARHSLLGALGVEIQNLLKLRFSNNQRDVCHCKAPPACSGKCVYE
jgi:hypothetical protein